MENKNFVSANAMDRANHSEELNSAKISLDKNEWAKFEAFLDENDAPNEALRKLLK